VLATSPRPAHGGRACGGCAGWEAGQNGCDGAQVTACVQQWAQVQLASCLWLAQVANMPDPQAATTLPPSDNSACPPSRRQPPTYEELCISQHQARLPQVALQAQLKDVARDAAPVRGREGDCKLKAAAWLPHRCFGPLYAATSRHADARLACSQCMQPHRQHWQHTRPVPSASQRSILPPSRVLGLVPPLHAGPGVRLVRPFFSRFGLRGTG